MESTLKKYFGYSAFRPYQKEVIENVLAKRDCLVVMATGSGKSICYQLPPLLVGKTGVVVSPLISLMQDQVMGLKQRGVRAEYLGSSQADPGVQTKAESGHFDILFMTPEKACSIPTSFWLKLLKAGLSLFAVDEAHCISEWGHSFRVDFKQLDKLRGVLLDVPFVGLTATATEKVRIDIIDSLKMKDPYIAIGSFDRENLFYGVKSYSHGLPSMDELVHEISKYSAHADPTIIYCTTIKDVEQIFKSLKEAGIKAGIYHGQMNSKARENSHRLFIIDDLQVMVATVAFGMGIDKPNIRHVIHYGCPKSLESYYQESGRCGRDGIASTCWLYYSRGDFAKADFYCAESQTETQRRCIKESLRAAHNYCLSTTCRRKFLLDHFGENLSADNCGNCDNCTISRKERDMSREAFLLMACIQSCRVNWGVNMPVDILRGSRSKKILDAQLDKLPLYGHGKDFSANWWKDLAHQLISYGYLTETYDGVYRSVRVSPKGQQFLGSAGPDKTPPLVMRVTNEMLDDEVSESPSSKVGEFKGLATSGCQEFSEAESQLYHTLLEERMKVARSTGTAPYAICGDQTIKRIALTRPSTKARLANTDGVNQHLLVTYGDHFLQIIRHLSQELNLSLDGEARIETVSARNKPVTDKEGKLTPAKFDAWRMWHEDGLSIKKIANLPSRPAPIKESTVCEYILEAAQKGLAFDWTRYCEEIGLTCKMVSDIQAAIVKAGSSDKLKLIKNELPEDITYAHIKTCLVMQSCGVSTMVIPPTSECSNEEKSLCSPNHNAAAKEEENEVQPLVKRQKVDIAEERSIAVAATEKSILDWLKDLDEGVPLTYIKEHFNGSDEESVVNLLNCLESEFLIYRKNNLYRLL